MSTLHLVTARDINAPPETATAAGLSVRDDLIVVAYIGRGLQKTQFFVHKSEKAFRFCPYWSEWRKNVTIVDDDFNVGRLLLDVGRQAKRVGYDPAELSISEANANVTVPVEKSLCENYLDWIERTNFLREVVIHAEEDPNSIAAMVRYFWESLRLPGGRRTLASPSDRPDAILAIINALAAEAITTERMHAEASSRRENELKEKRQLCADLEGKHVNSDLCAAMRKQQERYGYVRLMLLSRGGRLLNLPYEDALPLVAHHFAEFSPCPG
jgi:hypothetical protein